MSSLLLQGILLALLGLGVGIFSTGLGLGGGVLMVPAFITFVPGMDVHTAKGTSLFIILLVALSGFPRLRRAQKERPALYTAACLACGALAGGYAGAVLSTRAPDTVVLWFFLLFLSLLIVRLVRGDQVTPIQRPILHAGMVLFLIGAAAGFTGSATGTGGGAVMAPLVLLGGLLPHSQIVHVANQVIIATSLAAAPEHFLAEPVTRQYWTVGHIALGLVPVVFIAAQIGVVLGVKMNAAMTSRQRRLALALVLAVVTARMVAQTWQ